MPDTTRPPYTLRELYGGPAIACACAWAVLWLLILGYMLVVVIGQMFAGAAGNVAFALVELTPILMAVSIVGTVTTMIAYIVTGLVKRLRNRIPA